MSDFLNRTIDAFRRAWRSAGQGGGPLKEELSQAIEKGDCAWLRGQFDTCLAAPGGEVSARAQAAKLGGIYLSLTPPGRGQFMEVLAGDYGTDIAEINQAMLAVQKASDEARYQAERELRRTLIPPRVRLLTRFNELSLGVKFLVDLRADLLDRIKANPEGAIHLGRLNDELKELLASWFEIGLLELKQITWQTSAALLEKLIEYEAVHAIRSWEDLKNRLQTDRRCYAFFHPSMPEEPLIFVQVALVTGLSKDIHPLLDETLPIAESHSVDTAIFYSISNCQRGLTGVSFGNFLIKQVVKCLSQELPKLKIFATLSPIPGFRQWLRGENEMMGANEYEQIHQTLKGDPDSARTDHETPSAWLNRVLEKPTWYQNEALAISLEPILRRACSQYLLHARHRGHQASDPVAHFHLSNGAQVERLNWLADRSSRGLTQSAGMMVNYRYVLAEVDKNHENYATQGIIQAAPAIQKLANAKR